MMTNTIALDNKTVLLTGDATIKKRKKVSVSNLKSNGSLILTAIMFIIGAILALACNIPIKNVMGNYSYNVLVILIIMELFTNLIAETGIMQLLAIKIAEFSKGRKRFCLMMFFISSSIFSKTSAVKVTSESKS